MKEPMSTETEVKGSEVISYTISNNAGGNSEVHRFASKLI